MQENWDKHPSYGTVGFHRISRGGPVTLFGSSIRKHMTTVLLTIRRGERCHDLHEDRIMGWDKLLEVEMSSAQFAELLTTMNVGTGTPCTIRQIEGKEVPYPPDIEVEIDRVHDSFNTSISNLKEMLNSNFKKIEEIVFLKKPLMAEQKRYILGLANKIIQEVTSNIPFIIDQFAEATERITTSAKAEVDSFVTNVIMQTGLKQLQAISIDTKRLQEPQETDTCKGK